MNTSLKETFDKFTEPFREVIQKTPLHTDPYPFIECVAFDNAFCTFVKSFLPGSEEMVRLNQTPLSVKDNDNRKIKLIKSSVKDKRMLSKDLICKEENLLQLYAFFRHVVCPTVADKLEIKVPENFDDEFLYVIDGPGYKIGPHRDIDRKIMTVLVYLPDDFAFETHGTNVLVCNNGDCQTKHVARFIPGGLFAFQRSEKSWHSVSKVPDGVYRKLLIYTLIRP